MSDVSLRTEGCKVTLELRPLISTHKGRGPKHRYNGSMKPLPDCLRGPTIQDSQHHKLGELVLAQNQGSSTLGSRYVWGKIQMPFTASSYWQRKMFQITLPRIHTLFQLAIKTMSSKVDTILTHVGPPVLYTK